VRPIALFALLVACGDKGDATDTEPTLTTDEPTDTSTESDTDTDTDTDSDTDSDADTDGVPDPTSLKDVATRLDGVQGFGRAGERLAALPDVDGDGDDEWLIATPNLDNPDAAAISVGGVYVMPGGTVGNVLLDTARATIRGENNEDHLGSALATADIDGNGVTDILVGASIYGKVGLGDIGAFYGIPGTVTGEMTASAAANRVYGASDGDEFGYALAAGDLDGDPGAEVVVGAPSVDVDDLITDIGMVYVFPTPLPSLGFHSNATGTIEGLVSDRLGEALCLPGDMTGDGVGDLAIGADGRGFSLEGEVLLFHGPLDGLFITAAELSSSWTGVATADLAGHALSPAGDADGDGIADLWTGIPGARAASGEAALLGGAQTPGDLDLALARLQGGSADTAGTSVAGGSDVDGDGALDVIVGGVTEDHGGPLAGGAWVAWGPFSGVVDLETEAWLFFGEVEGDEAGTAVAMGQMDADGIADALVGAPGRKRSAEQAGAVYLLPRAF
jgi:hypothetical protein